MIIIRNGDESFLFFFAQKGLSVGEIAVSLIAASSHAPPQLMEARKSEILRINDDNRICREKIHSIFYNGRREQNRVFLLFEVMYSVLDIISGHSAVCGDNLGSRNSRKQDLEFLLETFHTTNSIMNDDDLSTAIEFCRNGGYYGGGIPVRDNRLYGLFLFGWC